MSVAATPVHLRTSSETQMKFLAAAVTISRTELSAIPFGERSAWWSFSNQQNVPPDPAERTLAPITDHRVPLLPKKKNVNDPLNYPR